MKIISPRHRVHISEFQKCYDYRGERGWGFAFPCHADGTLLPLAEPAQASLDAVLANLDAYEKPYIVDLSRDYTEPAVGKCDACGRKVYLEDALTNECDCGALYNGGGQALRPRHEWAEDCDEPADGESFFDA